MTKNSASQSSDARAEASTAGTDAPSEDCGEPGQSSSFPIACIGASAGGLEASTQLLAALPVDTGIAFVIVQHLAPLQESKLVSLLAKATPMPVLESTQGLAVKPNHVYIIPKNTTLTIAQGALQLVPRGEPRGAYLPIDIFLKSLAVDQQSAAIGVILSGTGSDGTLGLAEIKAVGGITFAQDKESAKHDGMPESAAASGSVDFILKPEEIARELERIGRHPYLAFRSAEREPADIADEPFRKVLAMLRSAFGVDFTHYRDTTIKRRTLRRMALHGQESLADYARQLEEDPFELKELYQDILINVTSFFRDAEMFEVLKTSVFPEIIGSKPPGAPIRVWAAGCSTGQEAYSLAIALMEFLDDKAVCPQIQVFATDLSDAVPLDKARAGTYPESIEAEVSPERLRRFFTKVDGKYRINKSVRDLCVFAKQNIVADPPFSRVDLISCRNVLIYLAPPLQKRVIPTFHYALNPKGFLILGTSETIGAFSDLFAVADKTHKIYSKKAAGLRQYPHFQSDDYGTGTPGAAKSAPQPFPNPADLQKEADRIVLGQYAPAGVLVSDTLEILHFRGRTSPYLEPAAGAASLNLLKMAREGLFVDLKSALDEAKRRDAPAERLGVRVRGEGHVRSVNLKIVPVKMTGMDASCFLVLFEQAEPHSGPEAAAAGRRAQSGRAKSGGSRSAGWVTRLFAPPRGIEGLAPPDDSERELVQLRLELGSAREQQQTTIEQHEAASEELKTANEEILSANEELQSTNEELSTAKEELQSVNEELTTVNEQLQSRNQELTRLNDDSANLLGSGNVPMVVLGIDLRVRRFTPAAEKVLNLLPADIGRPIGNLRLTFEVPDLELLLLDVIATVQVKEREVQDRVGRWHALRIHPYRTADNKIDGVVLVLADIDQSKSAQMRIKEAGDYAQAIVETVRDPLLILSGDLRVKSANESFYRTFQITPEETEDRFFYDLGAQEWDVPALPRLLEGVLQSNAVIEDFEVEQDFPGIGRRVMLLNARRLLRQDGGIHHILLAFQDITERRHAEVGLRGSEIRYRRLFESARDGILILDPGTRKITDVNPFMMELLQYSREELLGKEVWEIGLLGDEEASRSAFRELQEKGFMRYEDLPLKTKKGAEREVEFVSNLYWENGHQVIQCNIREIAARKQEERARREREELLKQADHRKNEFLAMLAHELRNPLAAVSNAVQVLRRPELEEMRGWSTDVIERQTKHLVRLIDDLLDVSRITQRKIQLRKEPVRLSTIIGRSVEAATPLIEEKKHVLSVAVEPDSLTLNADPARLEQIFTNLLTNAAKYTEDGGSISVSAGCDDGECVVKVEDTGVGISTEMLSHVFDLFTQVGDSLHRSVGGLGIGLTLVKLLAELHGGSVEASSKGTDKGSEFTVRLPLDQAEGKPPIAQSPAAAEAEPPVGEGSGAAPQVNAGDAAKSRILIVDDSVDTADGMAQLLSAAGHDIATAHDGAAVLDVVRSFRPDVVLLDIGLPHRNGYEVAQDIRQDDSCKETLLIAVSGFGQDRDRERSREAGFNHHLVKPVNIDTLIGLIGEK